MTKTVRLLASSLAAAVLLLAGCDGDKKKRATLDPSGDLEDAVIASDAESALPQRSADGGCLGDCNADGAISVDELVTGVNIAAGAAPPDACRAFEPASQQAIGVDEILHAVGGALNGCRF